MNVQSSVSDSVYLLLVSSLKIYEPGPGVELMPSEFVASFTEGLTPAATIRVYGDALDLYLSQALHAEAEAEYWARVEASTVGLFVYYFYSACGGRVVSFVF